MKRKIWLVATLLKWAVLMAGIGPWFPLNWLIFLIGHLASESFFVQDYRALKEITKRPQVRFWHRVVVVWGIGGPLLIVSGSLGQELSGWGPSIYEAGLLIGLGLVVFWPVLYAAFRDLLVFRNSRYEPELSRCSELKPSASMDAKEKAQRHWRTAVLIALVAPAYEYVRMGLKAMRLYNPTDDSPRPYEIELFFGLMAFALFLPLVWFGGLRVIQLASAILHAVFGGGVPRSRWQEVTFQSLWTLPYAAALGVTVWLVYSIGHFGGWPEDVIFGTIANLIGAWCYGTVFWNWFKVRRQISYAA